MQSTARRSLVGWVGMAWLWNWLLLDPHAASLPATSHLVSCYYQCCWSHEILVPGSALNSAHSCPDINSSFCPSLLTTSSGNTGLNFLLLYNFLTTTFFDLNREMEAIIWNDCELHDLHQFFLFFLVLSLSHSYVTKSCLAVYSLGKNF